MSHECALNLLRRLWKMGFTVTLQLHSERTQWACEIRGFGIEVAGLDDDARDACIAALVSLAAEFPRVSATEEREEP